MVRILLHPQTESDIEAYIKGQAHALLISGPEGAGKGFIARHITSRLLKVDPDQLNNFPFLLHINLDGTIGIDEIRKLHNFLKLKTTGQNAIRRVIIIQNAHNMTEEAQNSLLKALEEPPSDTIIILTAVNSKAILPTIISRTQQIDIKSPTLNQLIQYYQLSNVVKVKQAYMVSSGQMGLTSVILENEESSHILSSNIETAKQFLQLPVHERLLKVEEIIKDREKLNGLLFALKRIASTTLMQTSNSSKKIDVKRWHNVLKEVHTAEKRLLASANSKLTATDLALHL